MKIKSKVPPKLPTWLVKCMWRGTALKLLIQAKDETLAWDKAWKQVSRMMGGMECLEVKIIRRVE